MDTLSRTSSSTVGMDTRSYTHDSMPTDACSDTTATTSSTDEDPDFPELPDPSTTPTVLVLLIASDPATGHWFYRAHQRLAHLLSLDTTVRLVYDPADAIVLLDQQPRPRAVIVADAALTSTGPLDHKAMLAHKLAQYVRGGGAAIFACQFGRGLPAPSSSSNSDKNSSSSANSNGTRDFFPRVFSLPWLASTSALRLVSARNDEAARRHFPFSTNRELLRKAYSCKTAWLRGVAPGDAVYASADSPEDVVVAWGRVRGGEGRVGFVGDVEGGAMTDEVVAVMCGLDGPDVGADEGLFAWIPERGVGLEFDGEMGKYGIVP